MPRWSICPLVKVSLRAKCVQTERNTDGTEGSDRCFGCSVGKYGVILDESEADSRASCGDCPVGRFQPYVARDDGLDEAGALFDCWKCPMGFQQSKTGQARCENCEAGLVSFEGAKKCDVGCFEGSFRDAKGYPEWFRYGVPTANSSNWRKSRTAYDTRIRLTRPKPSDLCVQCPTGYSSSGERVGDEGRHPVRSRRSSLCRDVMHVRKDGIKTRWANRSAWTAPRASTPL